MCQKNIVTLLISALQYGSAAEVQLLPSRHVDQSRLVLGRPLLIIQTAITTSISYRLLHRLGHLFTGQGTDLQAQVHTSLVVGQESSPRLTGHPCLDQTGYLVPSIMIEPCY
jgi:hypothetical protein